MLIGVKFRVRKLRKAANLTQQQLADKVGLSVNTIWSIENMKTTRAHSGYLESYNGCRIDALQMIAKYFGCKIKDLIIEEGEPDYGEVGESIR